uniref:(northern house mosquito) hypothetical protein n=1 Tax=Culex pipiens TaxID=7175 RepID=A0A8D8C969_CULPI
MFSLLHYGNVLVSEGFLRYVLFQHIYGSFVVQEAVNCLVQELLYSISGDLVATTDALDALHHFMFRMVTKFHKKLIVACFKSINCTILSLPLIVGAMISLTHLRNEFSLNSTICNVTLSWR